jgi:hypothetical protein
MFMLTRCDQKCFIYVSLQVNLLYSPEKTKEQDAYKSNNQVLGYLVITLVKLIEFRPT